MIERFCWCSGKLYKIFASLVGQEGRIPWKYGGYVLVDSGNNTLKSEVDDEEAADEQKPAEEEDTQLKAGQTVNTK